MSVKLSQRSVSQLTAQLQECARSNSVAGIRSLLLLGADPHLQGKHGGTALHLAANLGNTAALVELLESSSSDPNAMTAGGSLPLHLAAKHGHLSVLETLLEADADPLALDAKGRTALIVAATHGHLNCLRRLADETPEPDSLDHMDDVGSTALHYCCHRGHTECAVALIERNATASLPNADGQTPAKIAALNGHSQTAVEVAVAERIASLRRCGRFNDIKDGHVLERQLALFNPKDNLPLLS
jgi:ankyrin repeat protein